MGSSAACDGGLGDTEWDARTSVRSSTGSLLAGGGRQREHWRRGLEPSLVKRTETVLSELECSSKACWAEKQLLSTQTAPDLAMAHLSPLSPSPLALCALATLATVPFLQYRLIPSSGSLYLQFLGLACLCLDLHMADSQLSLKRAPPRTALLTMVVSLSPELFSAFHSTNI